MTFSRNAPGSTPTASRWSSDTNRTSRFGGFACAQPSKPWPAIARARSSGSERPLPRVGRDEEPRHGCHAGSVPIASARRDLARRPPRDRPRRRPDRRLAVQPVRPAAQPRRQCLGADRGAAQAAVGPDPEPHRVGQGLCGARARDVRVGHPGAGARTAGADARRDGGGRGHPRARRSAGSSPSPRRTRSCRRTRTSASSRRELAETENRIAVSRQVYNDSVLTYNNAVQTFPGVVIAGPFGFIDPRVLRRRGRGQREPPRVDFCAPEAARRSTECRGGPRRALARGARPRARPDRTTSPSSATSRVAVSRDGAVGGRGATSPSRSPARSRTASATSRYREGERDRIVGVSEAGRPYAPGAPTELEPGGPRGTFGVERPRRADPGRLAIPGGSTRRARSRPLPDSRPRGGLRRRRRRQPQGLGRRVGAARSAG